MQPRPIARIEADGELREIGVDLQDPVDATSGGADPDAPIERLVARRARAG